MKMSIVMLLVFVLFIVVGCMLCIEVVVLEQLIIINMNVKIEYEIYIKVDKDVEEFLKLCSDLF